MCVEVKENCSLKEVKAPTALALLVSNVFGVFLGSHLRVIASAALCQEGGEQMAGWKEEFDDIEEQVEVLHLKAFKPSFCRGTYSCVQKLSKVLVRRNH
eukprot:4369517-Amphidinium_carterae.1